MVDILDSEEDPQYEEPEVEAFDADQLKPFADVWVRRKAGNCGDL